MSKRPAVAERRSVPPPSPARVDDAVVEQVRALAAAEIVEVVTFVSLLQLWHRVETFYAA